MPRALDFFTEIWHGLVPPRAQRDPTLLRHARRVIAFGLAMLFWVPVFESVYWLLDAPISSSIIGIAGVLLIGTMLLLRQGVSPTVCGNLITAVAFSTYTGLATL